MIAMILYLSLLAHMGEPQTFVPYTSRLYVPPMDVPAISEDRSAEPDSHDGHELLLFSQACEEIVGGKMTWQPDVIACHVKRWTCADKSRVLLTAEDGTRHCIKF